VIDNLKSKNNVHYQVPVKLVSTNRNEIWSFKIEVWVLPWMFWI